MSARPILLAAGGTGGHLFPAAALAQELKRRGYEVELATDERVEKYQSEFPARAIHFVPSATFTEQSSWTRISSRPLGPLTSTCCPWTPTCTPFGIAIGFFPILDIVSSLVSGAAQPSRYQT